MGEGYQWPTAFRQALAGPCRLLEKEKGRSAERPFPELQALSLRRRVLVEITP